MVKTIWLFSEFLMICQYFIILIWDVAVKISFYLGKEWCPDDYIEIITNLTAIIILARIQPNR